MLPEFDENGRLPPVIHDATFEEVIERFGGTISLASLKRQSITNHLIQFYEFAKKFAVRIYIDGSYVTTKLEPGDVDLAVILPGDRILDRGTLERLNWFIQRGKEKKIPMHIFSYVGDLPDHDRRLHRLIRGFIEDRPGTSPKGIVCVEVN